MINTLEIEGLDLVLPKYADRAKAVDGLSLSIAPGETLCLVGESGSGKSMTAHSLMGLLPSAVKVGAGKLTLSGQPIPVHDELAMRRIRGEGIGMIFQEPMTSLNPIMRIDRQLLEVYAAHGQKGAPGLQAKIEALLDEMGLPDPRAISQAYPHQLSGGQRQRIMIAMALALNPRLLIADEPTTALDVTTQAQILRLISELSANHGTAVLFITHDFGVVRDIADKVAVLRHGRLVEAGPADRVLADPQHDYTKALLAAVPRLNPRKPKDFSDQPITLDVRNVDKCYQPRNGGTEVVRAADKINFTLRRGETIGIVGESGSGKSTTARCVIRLIEADAGEVMIEGRDFLKLAGSELRKERAKIQMVFQDPYASLNPRQKVGAVLAEALNDKSLSRTETRAAVEHLLAQVKLPPQAADRYPHEFSGGQRQRIGIARALATRPDILIADEAVSALDVSVQASVLELLEELKLSSGISIIFVTHDLRVAAQISDKIAVMKKGAIVELKTSAELFANPEHEYTQSLLAAIPGREREEANHTGRA